MMEDPKTLWFYIFGLAGLMLVSILFTGRIEPPEVEPLPTMAKPTTIMVRPTPNPSEVDRKVCSITYQKVMLSHSYRASPEDQRLVISGTVYAADLVTPLSDIFIDVWRMTPGGPYRPSSPYGFRKLQTDSMGHYEFTTLRLSQYELFYLYYRARNERDCPLALQLFLVDELALADASSPSFPRMKQVPHAPLPTSSSMLMELGLAEEARGVLLQGPVDVVLPVSPPGH